MVQYCAICAVNHIVQLPTKMVQKRTIDQQLTVMAVDVKEMKTACTYIPKQAKLALAAPESHCN